MLKIVLLVIAVLIALTLIEIFRFRRSLKKSNLAAAEDVEIEVYNLDGDPDKCVLPEWSTSPGVLVSFPFMIPYALLREIAQSHKLFIMVKNQKQQRRCLKKLHDRSIDSGNVEWIQSKRNLSYAHTRDWGPYTLKNNEKFYLVDGFFRSYPYSGYDSETGKLHWISDLVPFLNTKYDNQAPGAVAEHFDVKREALSIALTGGSAMFDGHGTLFVCRIVIDENEAIGHSFEDFSHQLSSRLGVKRLIVLPNYRWSGIQHIDCLLKLLDQKRILVKKLDRTHPDYERVESIAMGLTELKNLEGDPYQIIRIDTPNYRRNKSAPYLNSLIFNDRIFVPIRNIPGDKAALRVWQEVMPDHEVIGFRSEKWMRPWIFTDALHCRTKSIFLPYDS